MTSKTQVPDHMTTQRHRRDPSSWTVVRMPECDLAGAVLELAAPLLERLGPDAPLDDARTAVALAVTFWNASVLASKLWEYPRVKELNDLRKRMRGRQAVPGDAAMFDLLTELRRKHWLDPRLVESWSYDAGDAAPPHLVCTFGLPDRVKLELPPPVEKRIAVGGKLLDEVRISLGNNTLLGFPVERHRGVMAQDGTATVYTMMPAALQLFAEGRLPRVGGAPVEIVISGQELGPMVLTQVSCSGENNRHDIAVLVFRPANEDG